MQHAAYMTMNVNGIYLWIGQTSLGESCCHGKDILGFILSFGVCMQSVSGALASVRSINILSCLFFIVS